jgi:hypothetical protein
LSTEPHTRLLPRRLGEIAGVVRRGGDRR